MIKKCASVKIIYIGLQICATYDGLNRLNSEMLLEEKSNFTQFPLPPSPPHFCILGYLEFLLIMRETRSTKQVPQPFQSFNLPDLPITPPPQKKNVKCIHPPVERCIPLIPTNLMLGPSTSSSLNDPTEPWFPHVSSAPGVRLFLTYLDIWEPCRETLVFFCQKKHQGIKEGTFCRWLGT